MKKFLLVGALALSVALLSQQRAAAWSKFNFSIGMNISYEAGNNSTLWGLFNNGQVPGYPSDSIHGFGGFSQGAPAPYAGYYGSYDYAGTVPYSYAPAANGSTFPPAPQQIPDSKKEENKKEEARLSWYGNPNYQPAVYYYQSPSPAPAATYAPAANYYYPSPYYYNNYGYYQGYGYSYGGQQVPSYWYGY